MKTAYEYFTKFCSEQVVDPFYEVHCPELIYCDKVWKLPELGYRDGDLSNFLKAYVNETLDYDALMNRVREKLYPSLTTMLLDYYETFYSEFGEEKPLKEMYKGTPEETAARIKLLLTAVMTTVTYRLLPGIDGMLPDLDEETKVVYNLFEETEQYEALVATSYLYFWYCVYPKYLDTFIESTTNFKKSELYKHLSKELTQDRTVKFNLMCNYARRCVDEYSET